MIVLKNVFQNKCQAWTLPGSSSRATAPAEDQFLVSIYDIIICNIFCPGLNHFMVLYLVYLFIYKKIRPLVPEDIVISS